MTPPARAPPLGEARQAKPVRRSPPGEALPAKPLGPYVARVPGVLGGHEGPFAAARHQGPPVQGLKGVVEPAQPVQQVEGGEVRPGPVLPMVALQELGPGAAALRGAGGVQPVQGTALIGVGPPAKMGYPRNFLPVGDDGL